MKKVSSIGSFAFGDSSVSSESSSVKVERKRDRIWRKFLDYLLFYLTSFFVLVAIFSIFALIFLVPFFIDPAWSTLQADFDTRGTVCRTVRGEYLKGKLISLSKYSHS